MRDRWVRWAVDCPWLCLLDCAIRYSVLSQMMQMTNIWPNTCRKQGDWWSPIWRCRCSTIILKISLGFCTLNVNENTTEKATEMIIEVLYLSNQMWSYWWNVVSMKNFYRFGCAIMGSKSHYKHVSIVRKWLLLYHVFMTESPCHILLRHLSPQHYGISAPLDVI